MFKRIALLVLLAIWLSLSPAYAGAAIPVKGYGYSSGLEAGTAMLVKNGPGLIYDITLDAGSTTSTVSIYDANSSGPALTGTNLIYEVEASAANSSSTVSFDACPLATTYGIEVSTANSGIAFLNYQ